MKILELEQKLPTPASRDNGTKTDVVVVVLYILEEVRVLYLHGFPGGLISPLIYPSRF